jgi:hypothetical protein
MSTAKFNTWLNPNGTENYKCRAWVNFNGVTTATIRASGNVSSVTRNGAGDYTVNFTTAMPDANYSAVATTGLTTTGAGSTQYSAQPSGTGTTAFATTAFRLWSKQGAGLADVDLASVAIFR